ncbi:MAG: acylphosphatase [Nitrospiraceae bacterium]
MTDHSPTERARARLLISGHVQGVGYRAFTRRAASSCGLVGGVRNLDDGRVEAEVEGNKVVILALLDQLKNGPPGARVRDIQVEWSAASGRNSDFQIWY